jgi:hypothetical protein
MSGGLDQYLASELSSEGIYSITTDPKKADAVLTDHLGPRFVTEWEELRAAPATPAPSDATASSSGLGKSTDRPRTSSWSRGRGNVFLVDAKSGLVLWSFTRMPKSQSPKAMVTQAEKIVDRLEKDLAIRTQ